MDYRTHAYSRSTKERSRHQEPAAPPTAYRSETKRQPHTRAQDITRWHLRKLKYAPAALLLAGTILQAQALPPEPQPHRITLQRSLYAVDLGLRALDIRTTHDFLNAPCQCFYEQDPLSPSGKGWAPVTAFQLGAFALVTGSSETLRRHHHPRLAIAVTLLDIAGEAWATQNNLRKLAAAPAPLSMHGLNNPVVTKVLLTR